MLKYPRHFRELEESALDFPEVITHTQQPTIITLTGIICGRITVILSRLRTGMEAHTLGITGVEPIATRIATIITNATICRRRELA